MNASGSVVVPDLLATIHSVSSGSRSSTTAPTAAAATPFRLQATALGRYLLYGPDARWDGPNPPQPQYWMHQLTGVTGPALDANAFADHARALLD